MKGSTANCLYNHRRHTRCSQSCVRSSCVDDFFDTKLVIVVLVRNSPCPNSLCRLQQRRRPQSGNKRARPMEKFSAGEWIDFEISEKRHNINLLVYAEASQGRRVRGSNNNLK